MVKMINGVFGTEMWVADDRVTEYLARGNRLAEAPAAQKPAESKAKKGRKK